MAYLSYLDSSKYIRNISGIAATFGADWVVKFKGRKNDKLITKCVVN